MIEVDSFDPPSGENLGLVFVARATLAGAVKYFFVNPPSAPGSSATPKAAFMDLERVIYEFAMDAIS